MLKKKTSGAKGLLDMYHPFPVLAAKRAGCPFIEKLKLSQLAVFRSPRPYWNPLVFIVTCGLTGLSVERIRLIISRCR